MNLNYYETQSTKLEKEDLFSCIFNINEIFDQFKIDNSISGEFITLQNIKYAIFYLTKKIVKKKEIIALLKIIRKELLRKALQNADHNKNNNPSEESLTTNYSYNLIEKAEFFLLVQRLLSEEKIYNFKISDYDMILEFYYSVTKGDKTGLFQKQDDNITDNYIENEIIQENLKITYEIFRTQIINIFPNVQENLIKDCFDRLDIDNLGFIKISSLEKFFLA